MSQKSKVLSLFGDTEIQPNTGKKYSELLNAFVQPYEPRFPKDYRYEEILQFGANAWNLATMEQFLPPEEVRRMDAHRDMPEPERTIMKQMIKKKSVEFAKYERFIVDFTLKETSNGKNKLSVVTQDKKVFFKEMMQELEEMDYDDDSFLPGQVDRLALILTAQQPFYDWLKTVDPYYGMADKGIQSNIYLVDDEIENTDRFIKKQFDAFFESELEAVHFDEENWPTKRTFKMFKEWFQFSFTPMVYDMEDRPIYKY